jgi:hypothetical protein
MEAAAARRHASFTKLGFRTVSLITLMGAIAALAQLVR